LHCIAGSKPVEDIMLGRIDESKPVEKREAAVRGRAVA
jgi:hypothetical protein